MVTIERFIKKIFPKFYKMGYTDSELKSFVDGMINVDNLIKKLPYDHIIAPLLGAVPFIDVLAIINPNMNLNSVEYSPETSKFENLGELMGDWYFNFITQNHLENEEFKLLAIDEVVSGTSAIRGHKFFNKSLEKIAKKELSSFYKEFEINPNEDTPIGGNFIKDYKERFKELKEKVTLITIGIEDKKGRDMREQNNKYNKLKEKNLIIPVEVERIIPMDNPAYSPVQLKFSHRNGHDRPFYYPEIESFNVTPEYIDFLCDIAKYMGFNPDSVNPINQNKIKNFVNYLSNELKIKD